MSGVGRTSSAKVIDVQDLLHTSCSKDSGFTGHSGFATRSRICCTDLLHTSCSKNFGVAAHLLELLHGLGSCCTFLGFAASCSKNSGFAANSGIAAISVAAAEDI